MDKTILEMAAKTLHIPIEEAENNCKKVPETEAWYFWKPVRGGGAGGDDAAPAVAEQAADLALALDGALYMYTAHLAR